jgi:hypothetical protein
MNLIDENGDYLADSEGYTFQDAIENVYIDWGVKRSALIQSEIYSGEIIWIT